MSKNTSSIPSFSFYTAAHLAAILLCVLSSLVFSNTSWAQKPTQEEITNLIEKLNTNDEWEREETIGELKKIAKDTVPDLVKIALEDESLLVRIGTQKALEYSDNGILADELIAALEDEDTDPKVRRRAIRWLSEMSWWELESKVLKFIPKLTKLLNHKDSDIRQGAVYTLGVIGKKAATDEVINKLTQLLTNKQSDVRSSAARALWRMGEKAATDEVINKLTQLLTDKQSYVRSSAADAVGEMGEKAATDEVINKLTQLLTDKQSHVRSSAASALGVIGKKAATDEVINKLTQLLTDKQSHVRGIAASALRRMGEKAATDEVINKLTQLLNHEDKNVRGNAVRVLGSMGEKAANNEVINQLTQLLTDKQSDVRGSAAGALWLIATGLQDKAQANQLPLSDFDKFIPKLEKALKIIENSESEKDDLKEVIAFLRRPLYVLKEKRNALFWYWFLKNPFIIIPSAYLLFLPSLWFLLLRFNPISLIQINEILKPYEFYLPSELGGAPIRTRDLLLFSFFKFRPRVLDAWVKRHIPTARERFELKKTVRDRSTHIPVTATLNNKDFVVVSGSHLKPTFNRNRACLLIWGEGGAGKTSLACQIGRWVMSENFNERPSKHLMLPVLIEEELRLKYREYETPLIEAIQGQLQDLIDSSKPISEELLEQLLRKQRILVIVDHFSEMSEATRKLIHPESPNFCINGLVVTSRLDEKLGQITKTTLHPHRIQGNRLSSFMDDYLTHRGKRENFTDIEFFDACIQLSEMVGERNITVLLAKLFAQQLITTVETRSSQGDREVINLPDNIPDLMLEYLNQINRDVVEDKFDDRNIHKDAKNLAWECLQQTLRPIPITRENALKALGGDDAEDRVNYLEARLHLIQTIGAAKDEIRFVLDPLAEYLAGLHLLEIFGNNQQQWEQFLQQAADTEDAPESIQGFLLALRDCYLAKAKQVNIPQIVADELENLPVLSHRQLKRSIIEQ